MAYHVSKETKNLTTRCPHCFQCLVNKTWDTCSIHPALPFGFLMINERCKNHCPSCFSYGASYYCNCPVQCEVHQNYQI